MTTANLTVRATAAIEKGYRYDETISDGLVGADVKIPALPTGKRINCTIIAGGNTGYFEISSSSDAKIADGTAVWDPWALGTQTGTKSDALLAGVSGIRGVSVAGEVTIEIII